MNKADLKAKYGEEKVLCIRNSNIKNNPTLNYLDLVKYYGYLDYRYEAELNFNAKQVIPYIVVISDGKVFVTKRIKGDERLIGGLSIGMGGHINDIDVAYDKKDLVDSDLTIAGCILRELNEETTIDVEKINVIELKDMFIDESNEVSKVHMCLLYVLNVSDKFDIKETDKLEGSLMTPEEIYLNYDKLESWSKIAFDKLFPNTKLTILSVDLANETKPVKATKRATK